MRKQLMKAALMSGAMISLMSSSFTTVASSETKALDVNSGARAGIIQTLACYQSLYSDNQTTEEIQYTGYTIDRINLRKERNTESEILDVIDFNTEITFSEIVFDSDWVKVSYNDQIGYCKKEYVSLNKAEYRVVSIPYYSGFKSYMDYTTISSTGSNQYKLQQMCYTGESGIRMLDGRYVIAIGTGADCVVGDYVDLVLENGTIIPCVVGDIKANAHTDSTNLITVYSNCASEFIVSTSYLPQAVRTSGNVSSYCDEWNSRVVTINVYELNALGV